MTNIGTKISILKKLWRIFHLVRKNRFKCTFREVLFRFSWKLCLSNKVQNIFRRISKWHENFWHRFPSFKFFFYSLFLFILILSFSFSILFFYTHEGLIPKRAFFWKSTDLVFQEISKSLSFAGKCIIEFIMNTNTQIYRFSIS